MMEMSRYRTGIRKIKREVPPRAVAEISGSALLGNYHAIRELVPHQAILPMIKANAYGHGAAWAARTLVGLPQLYAFGVATFEEADEIRSELGVRGRKVRIIVFSETSPWSDEKGNFCEQNNLTPVIATEADWAVFSRKRWTERISYELQFNTGLNRLGMAPSFARSILKSLKNKPATEHPVGVFSHLAMSESPDEKLSQTQLEKFKLVKNELIGLLSGAQFHLANSGGIWNHKSFGLKELTDVVRPGLSLYGIPPWPGAPEKGIEPVMELKAQVMAVHRLKPGDSIGYGGTFKVKGTDPVFAAILGAGYADGVLRAFSNQGYAVVDGQVTRFLGMVSMDLCAVQCFPNTAVGSWVEWMGPRVDPWTQAQAAGTIPYEVLTSVSTRVKRIYESQSKL